MRTATILVCAAALASCKRSDSNLRTASDVPKKSPVVETAGGAPDRWPLQSFRVYLNDFHFRSGEMSAQVEAHHFCSQLNEDILQCVLFDGNGETAHLTGIEYVVSRRMFESFPPEERKLWHSHVYAVKSGQLMAPALSASADRELMKQLVSTYGKTWHTWHSQGSQQLPIEGPALMASFTADGQLQPELLQFRDERMQVSSVERRKQRDSIPDPGIAEHADSWQTNDPLQVQILPVKPDGKGSPSDRPK